MGDARRYICVANAAYLPQLKVLHASMLRFCQPFNLHVIPWDRMVTEWATKQIENHVVPWAGHAMDWAYRALPGEPRTEVERMWAARVDLLAKLLAEGAPSVIQIDADVMFFDSPEWDLRALEAAHAPAAVMPHYFAGRGEQARGVTWETHAQYGDNNAGFVYVANARLGRRWANQCRDWCYARTDVAARGPSDDQARERPRLYADQAYLNDWRRDYGAVPLGSWVAPGPWMALSAQEGLFHGGRRRLVAWHFSSFRMNDKGVFQQYANPEYELHEKVRAQIYSQYEVAMFNAIRGFAL